MVQMGTDETTAVLQTLDYLSLSTTVPSRVKLGIHILTLIVSFMLTATVAAAETADGMPPDDGFSPRLFFNLLFVGAVFFILVGIGIVVGLVGAALAGVFIGLGIVSTAALSALLRRRFSAGLRALHYQLSAVVALPFGIGA